MKRIAFVCLGNICRSPMAEFVMKSLTDALHIESRATSSWEQGIPIHTGTRAILTSHQIPFDPAKTSQHVTLQDFVDFDFLIGMDASNVADLKKMAPEAYQDKIVPFAAESVPDPWYTGDFDDTYQRVTQGCTDWLHRLLPQTKD